jgi:hypothetical protein
MYNKYIFMEQTFWECIETEQLSTDISMKEFYEFYRELVSKACYTIVDYFNKDPNNDPKHNRFYERPGDCYDGIIMDSDYFHTFIESIIMSGKSQFDEFIKNPFNGDIMNNLKRDISCGNSSCLYLQPISHKTLYNFIVNTEIEIEDEDKDTDTDIEDDNSIALYYTYINTDFLNNIFDIVIDPYL